jgi:cell wall-associated NlpC family hydrolase
MSSLKTILLFGMMTVMGVGCGVVPRSSAPVESSSTSPSGSEDQPSEGEQVPAMSVSSVNEARASLMQAYRDWKGTPYKLGGSTKQGVDCSLFVHTIFDNYFGKNLPTNTRTQLNSGKGIRRSAVRTGDLVFFRTGRKTLHVGIAVNKGEFLHASTSNGVMISKLGNKYWRNRFLAARRVM